MYDFCQIYILCKFHSLHARKNVYIFRQNIKFSIFACMLFFSLNRLYCLIIRAFSLLFVRMPSATTCLYTNVLCVWKMLKGPFGPLTRLSTIDGGHNEGQPRGKEILTSTKIWPSIHKNCLTIY